MKRSLPKQRDGRGDVPQAHGSVGAAAEDPGEAELDGFEAVHVTGENAHLGAVRNVPNADALIARSSHRIFIVTIDTVHQVCVAAGQVG